MSESKTLSLPILLNHDSSEQIGVVEVVEGRLLVRFKKGYKINRAAFFAIFGGAGMLLEKYETWETDIAIEEGEILEFSLVSDAESALAGIQFPTKEG